MPRYTQSLLPWQLCKELKHIGKAIPTDLGLSGSRAGCILSVSKILFYIFILAESHAFVRVELGIIANIIFGNNNTTEKSLCFGNSPWAHITDSLNIKKHNFFSNHERPNTKISIFMSNVDSL